MFSNYNAANLLVKSSRPRIVHRQVWMSPSFPVSQQAQVTTIGCLSLAIGLTFVYSYLLTKWSRVLLEKLTVCQLIKKFPAFYGNRRFITAFTSARHLSLSWASSIQSILLHPTSWRSILILSNHTTPRSPKVFPPKPRIHLSSPPYAPHFSLIPFVSILSTEKYWVRSTDH
jgi:hypothetical protein